MAFAAATEERRPRRPPDGFWVNSQQQQQVAGAEMRIWRGKWKWRLSLRQLLFLFLSVFWPLSVARMETDWRKSINCRRCLPGSKPNPIRLDWALGQRVEWAARVGDPGSCAGLGPVRMQVEPLGEHEHDRCDRRQMIDCMPPPPHAARAGPARCCLPTTATTAQVERAII